jgi:hypothetical protein
MHVFIMLGMFVLKNIIPMRKATATHNAQHENIIQCIVVAAT